MTETRNNLIATLLLMGFKHIFENGNPYRYYLKLGKSIIQVHIHINSIGILKLHKADKIDKIIIYRHKFQDNPQNNKRKTFPLTYKSMTDIIKFIQDE